MRPTLGGHFDVLRAGILFGSRRRRDMRNVEAVLFLKNAADSTLE